MYQKEYNKVKNLTTDFFKKESSSNKAFIKNANGNWYHFNDTNVSQITNLDELITTKAYCLFYRKKTI